MDENYTAPKAHNNAVNLFTSIWRKHDIFNQLPPLRVANTLYTSKEESKLDNNFDTVISTYALKSSNNESTPCAQHIIPSTTVIIPRSKDYISTYEREAGVYWDVCFVLNNSNGLYSRYRLSIYDAMDNPVIDLDIRTRSSKGDINVFTFYSPTDYYLRSTDGQTKNGVYSERIFISRGIPYDENKLIPNIYSVDHIMTLDIYPDTAHAEQMVVFLSSFK